MKQIDMKALGSNIVYFRKAIDLNQSQLARRTGIAPSSISRYENGVQLPDLSTLFTIAEALSCSMDQLVRGQSGKPKTHDAFDFSNHDSREKMLLGDISELIFAGVLVPISDDPKYFNQYMFNDNTGELDEFFHKILKAVELSDELGLGGWFQLREATIRKYEKKWQQAIQMTKNKPQ